MGFGGISVWSLLLILAIVVMIFGTRKLRNAGSDVGGAVKNFKEAIKSGDEKASQLKNKAEDVIEDVVDDVVKTKDKA